MEREDIPRNVVRAQYVSGESKGSPWLDICRKRCCPEFRYGDLRGVESFIDNWRWSHVPFYIYTGKRLKDKRSGVVIHFKSTPHKLFQGTMRGFVLQPIDYSYDTG